MSEAAHFWDEAAKCRRALAHTDDRRSRAALQESIATLEEKATLLVNEERKSPAPRARCEFYALKGGERWLIDAGTPHGPHILHETNDSRPSDPVELDFLTFLSLYGRDTAPHKALMRFLSAIIVQRAD